MRKKRKILINKLGHPTANPADPLNSEEIQQIKDYFDTLDTTKPNILRNKTIALVGITFALRGGDLLSLPKNLIFKNGQCVSHFYIIEQKTHKRRFVTINSYAKSLLQTYYDTFKDTVLKSTPYLFPSRKKTSTGYLSVKSLDRIFKDIQIGAGIDTNKIYASHSMRKTASQKLFEQGKSISEIQLFLGHQNLNTTKFYIRLQDIMANDMYNAIDI